MPGTRAQRRLYNLATKNVGTWTLYTGMEKSVPGQIVHSFKIVRDASNLELSGIYLKAMSEIWLNAYAFAVAIKCTQKHNFVSET